MFRLIFRSCDRMVFSSLSASLFNRLKSFAFRFIREHEPRISTTWRPLRRVFRRRRGARAEEEDEDALDELPDADRCFTRVRVRVSIYLLQTYFF